MTHAKDYIDARHQVAKASMPGIKVKLEQLIDDSKAEFIENGKIYITDEVLTEELRKFVSQSSRESVNELCDWLKEFGWVLIKVTDPIDCISSILYYLRPTDEYRK